MKIDAFCSADIAPFVQLAEAEEWIAEPWEFEFLLSEFPQGCFSARGESGEGKGFITSLRHERSGWIGNLIVNSEYRGKGIGTLLFKKAMETLLDSGVATLWLTASKSGMPLYQKFGFTRIDTINRWSGVGRQRLSKEESEATDANLESILNELDSQVWGDRRDRLLAVIAASGRAFQEESGFVVAQRGDALRQIGPFTASSYCTADLLLKAALNSVSIESKVCIDAPASNRTALQLFDRNKMKITGSNELMYFGVKPAYRPELLYGLATMGSCG